MKIVIAILLVLVIAGLIWMLLRRPGGNGAAVTQDPAATGQGEALPPPDGPVATDYEPATGAGATTGSEVYDQTADQGYDTGDDQEYAAGDDQSYGAGAATDDDLDFVDTATGEHHPPASEDHSASAAQIGAAGATSGGAAASAMAGPDDTDQDWPGSDDAQQDRADSDDSQQEWTEPADQAPEQRTHDQSVEPSSPDASSQHTFGDGDPGPDDDDIPEAEVATGEHSPSAGATAVDRGEARHDADQDGQPEDDPATFDQGDSGDYGYDEAHSGAASSGGFGEAPYGPGSASPAEDGSGPSGWKVKGNAGSMLFHTEQSPSYEPTRAEVWFESEEAARAAGFAHWDRKQR